MKLLKSSLSVCLAVACLALVAFGGCAANADRLPATPQDPSRPNIASIYYYFSASYLHFSGDYISAGQLYSRALEQDSASTQISKQILINTAYAYLNGQMPKDEALALFNEARQKQTFDRDLLSAAYTVYNQANDLEGQEWSVNESVARFPSARIYVQKFYLAYSKDGSLDREALAKAIKLANGNHDDLVLTARMSTLTDPQQAIDLLKKALRVENRSETQKLLADITLQYGSTDDMHDCFNAYSYSSDKSLMLYFLQQAAKGRRLEQIIALQHLILPTADASLLGELAFAAYLRKDSKTLNAIWKAMQTRPIKAETDSKPGVFLLAEALYSEELPEPEVFTDLLYSTQDADDLMLYHTLRSSLSGQSGPQPDSKALIAELAQKMQERAHYPELGQYLMAASQSNGGNDPAYTEARNALCESFVQKDMGYESDWSAVLTAWHSQKRYSEKLGLLRRALKRFPDDPLFLNDLGYSLLDYPDSLAEAGLLISRAVALEPDNPYYQDSLAWYHYLQGDYAIAMEHIALPRQMENPPSEIAYHIGMILKANNELESAKEFFLKASEDESSSDYADKAKQALEAQW